MKPHSAATAYMAAMEFADKFGASCDIKPLTHVANGKHPKADVLLKKAELIQWLEPFKGLLHYTENFSAFITADNGLAQVPSTWSISIQDILQDEDTYECTEHADARAVKNALYTERDMLIGAKKQLTKIMGKIFGEKTVQLVTHDNHGRPKNVDDYLIKDIMDMVEAKALTPSPATCLEQMLNLYGFRIDFTLSFTHNMGIFNQKNAELDDAYGAPLHSNAIATLIMPQIYWASRQSWGQCFHQTVSDIKTRWAYNHVYDQNDLDELIELISDQDRTRDLAEASSVPDDMSTAFAVNNHVPFTEDHLASYLTQVALQDDPYHDVPSVMSDDSSVVLEEGNLVSAPKPALSANARRQLLQQAKQALEEKEAAIKAAKQARKKAQSKKPASNGSGDKDDDASDFPPQSCPHCAFIKMKTPHPEHITPETCHANPVNIKKAPKFILKKYIAALGEADE